MIGFLPGFPYLGVLDSRLRLPRRDVPRPVVPRGSVAIAGAQTGIYPSDSPGGWHVIGRTPSPLFDPAATPPGRLSPGDRVRFVPVPAGRFESLAGGTAEAMR
jgi:KipI family sensor histidine kinase inhibitor